MNPSGRQPSAKGRAESKRQQVSEKASQLLPEPISNDIIGDITETGLVPNIRLLIADLHQNTGPKELRDKNQHKQPNYFFFLAEMKRKYCGL